MSKFISRRAKQNLEKQQSTETGNRKRRRSKERLVAGDIFMPVIIKGYKDNIPTTSGKTMSSYDLEHLVSGEAFSATVFENQAPDYIDDKILDVVLPEDQEDFTPEDLIGRGFRVKVKFNTSNDRVYINIVDAKELDLEEQEIVEAKQAEQQAKQPYAKNIQGNSNRTSKLEEYDPFSNQQTEKVSMEDMESPDPYTHGANNRDSFESESKTAPFSSRPDRRTNYKRVSQITEDHLDEEDDESEVYLCDVCNDTGCEECAIDIDLDPEEDFCIVCDGRGCEYCANNTDDNEENDY